MPAKAGIQVGRRWPARWIPAFAGMTSGALRELLGKAHPGFARRFGHSGESRQENSDSPSFCSAPRRLCGEVFSALDADTDSDPDADSDRYRTTLVPAALGALKALL